jgi:hypothetical protein
VLLLTIFQHPRTETFRLVSFLASKASVLSFLCKKAHQTKGFCPTMVKNFQHQHKGKPHTREKSQDAVTSMEDTVTNAGHTSALRPRVDIPEEHGEFHGQEAAECLQECGKPPSTSQRSWTYNGPISWPKLQE